MKKLKLNKSKFGKWTVLGETKSKNKHSYWLCKCECGREKNVRGSELKSGSSLSCGSCNKIGKLHISWNGYRDISGQIWSKIKDSAKNRNLSFEIDIEYGWKIFLKQRKKCALSGVELNFGSRHLKKETTASLDRIDSSIGYIKGNLQWIHKTVNKMKTDLCEKDFVYWCKKISNNLK